MIWRRFASGLGTRRFDYPENITILEENRKRLTLIPCSVHQKSFEVSHLGVADDITDLVGGTPMLRLKRLVTAGSADIFAKLEYLNPGGSVKDRAAIGIIRRAEQEGKLAPGGTIVEKLRRGIRGSGWR